MLVIAHGASVNGTGELGHWGLESYLESKRSRFASIHEF